MTGLLRRWRDKALAGRAPPAGAAAAAANETPAGGKRPEADLRAAVRQCYALYCSLDPDSIYSRGPGGGAGAVLDDGGAAAGSGSCSGSCGGGGSGGAFALDLAGFRRLMADARVCSCSSGSEGDRW